MPNNTTAVIVADEVRAAMGRRRFSGARLAKALDMSQSALARRLTGDIPFDVAELSAIATVLNVPLSALVVDPDGAKVEVA